MATPVGTYVDPYRAFNFKIEIQGITEGHFIECSGLGAKLGVAAYREAGNNQVVHYVPGHVEYSAITLRYGVTKSKDLFEWFKTGVKGQVQRKNISIVLVDADGTTEVMRWNLVGTFVKEWIGSFLDARSQEVAIESITLVCESMDRG